MKISFICMRIKHHFHTNCFSLSHALKQRLAGGNSEVAYYTATFSFSKYTVSAKLKGHNKYELLQVTSLRLKLPKNIHEICI